MWPTFRRLITAGIFAVIVFFASSICTLVALGFALRVQVQWGGFTLALLVAALNGTSVFHLAYCSSVGDGGLRIFRMILVGAPILLVGTLFCALFRALQPPSLPATVLWGLFGAYGVAWFYRAYREGTRAIPRPSPLRIAIKWVGLVLSALLTVAWMMSLAWGATRATGRPMVGGWIPLWMAIVLIAIPTALLWARDAKVPSVPTGGRCHRLSRAVAVAASTGCFLVLVPLNGYLIEYTCATIWGSNFVAEFTVSEEIILILMLTVWAASAYVPARIVYSTCRWRVFPGDIPHCPHCGYNLAGNVSGRCSECGNAA